MQTTQHMLFEKGFILYILLQPLLDVTAFMGWPLSEYVRMTALTLGIIYIALQRKTPLISGMRLYIMILIIFMTAHFVLTMLMKHPFHFNAEATYMIKNVYFLVMMLVYAIVFQSMAITKNRLNRVWELIVINISVIASIMVLATLTETGRRTYGALSKTGHSGWFFSGNELSAILAMGFTVMVMFVLKSSSRQKMWLLPVALLTIWSMLMIGTKVAFGSVLIILAAGFTISMIDRQQRSLWKRDIGIVLSLIIATVLIFPWTPIANNIDFFLGGNQNDDQPVETDIPGEEAPALLSGRSDFLDKKISDYLESSSAEKMFGMGYAGHYDTTPKLIEMDFLDWYFSYGPIGFFIMMLPLFYFGAFVLKRLIAKRFRLISIEMIWICLAIGLGLGTAAVAGHVLSSPSVSIYLALLIGVLFMLINHQTELSESGMYDATKIGKNISNQHDVSK